MKEYKAKDFNKRIVLDEQVVFDFGKTTDLKDAKITGTTKQLKELGLAHGLSVWGVVVEATDYKVNNVPKIKRGIRGKRFPSKINGQIV